MRGMAVIGVLGAVLIAGAGAWYAMAGGDAPAPVSLDAAASKLQGSATGTAIPKATASVVAATIPNSTAVASATGASAAATPTAAAKSEPAAGARWTVDGANSFVGYRVGEQLAGIGANTAVGRTSSVSGDLTFDGRAVSVLQVKADLRQLKSDDNRRDNYLRRSSLESDRLPDATFVLAEPIAVSVAAAEGAAMSATARGDFTLHGVTKRVEIPVEGKITGGKLLVVGSLRVPLADYGIAQPRVPLVLSVDEIAVMELSLVFSPAS